MNIRIVNGIEAARNLRGYVVVIDTFRACNTILAMLERKAKEIYIPASHRQAGKLRSGFPDSLYFAENKGDKLAEADYDNSPSQASKHDLAGKTIILYTSRGSKAISTPRNVTEILVASFGNAQAIADYLQKASPDNLTFVACGEAAGVRAVEDYRCAEFIQSLVEGNPLDYQTIKKEILQSNGARRLRDNNQTKDLELCLELNYSKIIPRAERKQGVVVVKKV